MFTMDVPSVPAQETPIVLAQTATPSAGATPQPDYIIKTCVETQEMGGPRAAWRAVDAAGLLAVYLQSHDKRTVDMEMLAAIKTTLLQGPKHGKLFSEVDNLGLTSYHYDPTSDYIGDDRAVFQAEFEGKVYKIVVDIKVLIVIDNNSPQCDPPKLIKVNKPTSGASGFGSGYDLNSIGIIFADLTGAALGQTTTGITLDTTAAGYNWFIAPLGQNEEWLPTGQIKGARLKLTRSA